MSFPFNKLMWFAAAAALAVALSGCGGGSSTPAPSMMPGDGGTTMMPGDGGTPMTPFVSVFEGAVNADQVTAENVIAAIGKAAQAQPKAGSVTQSSNVDSGGITTDKVEVTAAYGASVPRFSVRNGTEWSIGMNEGNPRPISDVSAPWKGSELSKRVNGGTVYVDAYTDIEAPTTSQVSSGDDGTRDVQLGTQIQLAGITAGGGVNVDTNRLSSDGSLAGESGRFECSSGCMIVDGQITGGVWKFTPDRPPGAVVVSGNSGVAVTGSFNSDRWSGTYNGEAGYFRCLSDSCGSRTVNGRLMLGTGEWIFVPTSGTIVTILDTDYLSGGVWLLVPDNRTSAADYVFGAFVDGSDPFLQSKIIALQRTATYEGAATGVYSAMTPEEGTSIGYFNGDVTLNADFGGTSDLGTISGSITNFEVDGEREDGMLTLGTAPIGSQNSGFFKGQVSGSDVEHTYVGNWGGQFFGNSESDGKPGSVAGTFGGHSTDDAVNFVGAFGAHKQ